MSRSYRKPYLACCSKRTSAKRDKRKANRAIRRTYKEVLRTCLDYEEFYPIHRYECPYNNVYSWVRDGKQRYQYPRPYEWVLHLEAIESYALGRRDEWTLNDMEWPPSWYIEIRRK